VETTDVTGVMNGDLDSFIEAYLRLGGNSAGYTDS
jgi:peptide chain release factor 2